MRNRQVGPDDKADILADLVKRLEYKHWQFELAEVSRGQGCEGLTLQISATVPDATEPGKNVTFLHLMPVMPAAYNERAWKRWLLEQILLVEKHECLEFFKIDGDAVFFPSHAPGDDPYSIMEIREFADAHGEAEPYHGGSPQDEHFA